MRGKRMMLTLYSAAGYLLTPGLHGWLARRAKRSKEDPARKAERFGHASAARPAGKLIWLHAASVGEAQSVLTLVRGLLARDSSLSLLITTGTVTSAALVAQQNLPRVIHQYLPVDTPPAARRFLAHWHPDAILWVESEFWPQLLLQAHARAIPILLINARLSATSFTGWKRWPRAIRRILGCFTAIYAGSADDAARLRALGAGEVIEAGNLKFDAAPLRIDETALAELQQQIQHRPCWLAASTHANEEQRIAQQHLLLKTRFPGLLTIIAPRHATRGDTVAETLRHDGLTVAQRSKGEAIASTTDIYLADTMGELGTFYRLSPLVFLGGSLIAHGGHNPLEPARLGCAMLSGPHVHNFSDIMQQLQAAHAIEIVADAAQLGTEIARLLADIPARTAMAARAQAELEKSGGGLEKILLHCSKLLP